MWPVKRVPDMTYNVFGGTLNLAQSICISASQHDRAEGSLAPGENHEVALENTGWSKSLRTWCLSVWSCTVDQLAWKVLRPINGQDWEREREMALMLFSWEGSGILLWADCLENEITCSPNPQLISSIWPHLTCLWKQSVVFRFKKTQSLAQVSEWIRSTSQQQSSTSTSSFCQQLRLYCSTDKN